MARDALGRARGPAMRMLPWYRALALIAVAFTPRLCADELSALRIRGTHLVNETGAPVQLRGVNLGCWLLLEPHFLGLSFRDDKSLWAGLEQHVGKAKA